MSRTLSLTARRANEEGMGSDEVALMLFRFRSPDLTQIIRLTTDPTEMVSTDPIEYGTRSSWMGANPATDPYKYVLAGAQLPDDGEGGAEGQARLVFDLVDASLIALLQSFSDPAPVDMAVVLASSPDLIEAEFLDMQMVGAEEQGGQLVLTITANPIAEENFPAPRMTRSRFPGLFA